MSVNLYLNARRCLFAKWPSSTKPNGAAAVLVFGLGSPTGFTPPNQHHEHHERILLLLQGTAAFISGSPPGVGTEPERGSAAAVPGTYLSMTWMPMMKGCISGLEG